MLIYPLLEIYVIQERAKLEAAEADEAPVAQAQPPPEIAMGGRDVAYQPTQSNGM